MCLEKIGGLLSVIRKGCFRGQGGHGDRTASVGIGCSGIGSGGSNLEGKNTVSRIKDGKR